MSADPELARVPASEDPSVCRPRTTARRRFAVRAAPVVLLLVAACSRLAPADGAKAPAASATGAVNREAAPREAQRARGEEPTEARVQEAKAEVSKDVPAEKSIPEPTAPPMPKRAPSTSSYGVTGAAAPGYGSSGLIGGRDQGAGLGASAAVRSPVKQLARRMPGRQALATHGTSSSPAPLTDEKEFDTEAYKSTPDNPFRLVKDAPLSTFSVDVDTASYSNMRRFVEDGRLPPADAIRTEEWINYFSYDDAPPTGGEPIRVASELTECPWASGHELLRVALTTQPVSQDRVPPRNLVFLVDVSGSMQPPNKLPLLKRGLAMLARQLRPSDTLSIVVYAGASGVALPPTSGAEQGKILAALQGLESGGSTNGAEGIQLAYRIAEQQMKRGGINRVLLATDGDFNVGVTSEGELTRLIESERKTGVFLTVLGFGEGNLKDSTMESLADKGNGNYAYIDSLEEARKVLVREAGATLVTVAQDVKLQLEFNPTRVNGYRLVGYEDRVLADQDFNDDTKDAGDMGAGHHVTAFYEIVPASGKVPAAAPVDPLKYQTERKLAGAAASGELVTVKIRYKAPGGSKSLLTSRPVLDQVVPLANTSNALRFGAAVAEYSLALRGAEGVGKDQLRYARALALGSLGSDPGHERREFVALMDRAGQLLRE